MNSKEFFMLAAKMRKAQRSFFATRDKAYLQEAMHFERIMDSEIERVKKLTSIEI